MKIIDFEKFGNTVKFYLGEDDCEDYWGDDWDDTPYEHNAGPVYDRFVKGVRLFYFDYKDLVLEPCEGDWNSRWCKDDMKNNNVPCILYIPHEIVDKHDFYDDFNRWLAIAPREPKIEMFYFNDFLIPGASYRTDEFVDDKLDSLQDGE